MTAARGISRDAKYAGCFLLVTFLLRQKKSNIQTLKPPTAAQIKIVTHAAKKSVRENFNAFK